MGGDIKDTGLSMGTMNNNGKTTQAKQQ